VNPKPKPPLPGGEHVQFIDSGPQGVSPNATRVNLIPIGDGGPGPLLPPVTRRKRSSGVDRSELTRLRHWVVAVVGELRQEVERLKAVAEYAEARTTLDEF
jgi:hypothetical protein